MGKLGWFVCEAILLYIVIFVAFSLHDHRFTFSWLPVTLALIISLTAELMALRKSN